MYCDIANGNSFALNGGSMNNFTVPGEESPLGSRPASASWLYAVVIWRCR